MSIALFAFFQLAPAMVPIDSLVSAGADRNPAVRAAFFRYRAEAERVAGAGALPEPMAMFRLFLEPGQNAALSGIEAGIQQQLPWPGVRKTARDGANLQAQLRFSEAQTVLLKARHETRQRAFEWLMEFHMARLEARQISLLEQAKSIADARISSGKASAADALMLEIRLETMKNDRLNRLKRLKSLEGELKAATGLAVVPDTTLPSDPLPLPETTGLPENSPSLEASRAMERMAENDLEMARLDRRPMMTATLGVMTARPLGVPGSMDDRPMYMPQVNVSLPMFSPKSRSGVQVAHQRRQAASLDRESMERMTRSELETARNDLEIAESAHVLATQQAGRADRVLSLRLQEYGSGAVTFDALSEALMLPLAFHTERLSALFNWHIARSRITFLTASQS